MAANLGAIRFVITCDLDDVTMNNNAMRQAMNRPGVEVFFGNSKTKIEACNANVPADGWDILVLASDDMLPRVNGWDAIIRAQMQKNYPDLDGVLNFHDGHQGDRINTLPVMGKTWYDRFGYVYNPLYETMYCDTELTMVSRLLNRETYLADVIIEHLHPYSGAVPYDDLYRRNNDAGRDSLMFSWRREQFFYLPRVLIKQPGRTGDILITLPIAKQLHRENNLVYWYCPPEYHDIFKNIDYAQPVAELGMVNCERIIDLSFGFGGLVEKWWQANKSKFDSFVTAKYYLAQTSVRHRWALTWQRRFDDENSLFALLKLQDRTFALTQEETHLGRYLNLDLPGIQKVEFTMQPGFNIFAWYKVIDQAKEIHCIDSALANFIEAVPAWRSKEKHLYITVRETNAYLRSIYRNNWIYETNPN